MVILWIIKEKTKVKKVGILELRCSVSSSSMNFLNEFPNFYSVGEESSTFGITSLCKSDDLALCPLKAPTNAQIYFSHQMLILLGIQYLERHYEKNDFMNSITQDVSEKIALPASLIQQVFTSRNIFNFFQKTSKTNRKLYIVTMKAKIKLKVEMNPYQKQVWHLWIIGVPMQEKTITLPTNAS